MTRIANHRIVKLKTKGEGDLIEQAALEGKGFSADNNENFQSR